MILADMNCRKAAHRIVARAYVSDPADQTAICGSGQKRAVASRRSGLHSCPSIRCGHYGYAYNHGNRQSVTPWRPRILALITAKLSDQLREHPLGRGRATEDDIIGAGASHRFGPELVLDRDCPPRVAPITSCPGGLMRCRAPPSVPAGSRSPSQVTISNHFASRRESL